MKRLSKVAEGLIGQPMFKLMTKAKKIEQHTKVIHFEIGDPNFTSPSIAINAAKTALDNGWTHYTNSMGMIEFRETIAEISKQKLGFKPIISQIVVTPANAAIDFVCRCVVDPGEEIIYPDPGFPTYFSVINYNKFVPVPIQLKEKNNFRMNPEDIRKKITSKTRLIIINTPHNPTGSVITKDEILEIAQIAAEHDIYLLSDEVYTEIVYNSKHFSPSSTDLCKERTIVLNSLSKSYSMSGWRLGYIIGPENVAEKIGLLVETILSCIPPFIQIGGRAALLGNQEFLYKRNLILRKRRDLLINGLNKLSGISCLTPEGSFYAFPNIKNTGMTCEKYSEKLLSETGVCVLPGNCFGPFGEGYLRLCYASTSEKTILEALGKMQMFHSKNIKKPLISKSSGELV